MIGRSSQCAISAVLPESDVPSKPSYSPMTPSTIATSLPAAVAANSVALGSLESLQSSRLCAGTPDAISCSPGSIKSGPTLNDCTDKPRADNAESKPRVTVVLPAPVMAPETTNAFMDARIADCIMIKTIEWTDEGVRMIDQRKLPTIEEYPVYKTYQEVADAIKTMV